MIPDLTLRAQRAAVDVLSRLKPGIRFLPEPFGYVEDWAANLIDGVSTLDFEADLQEASGSELTEQPVRRAKFGAAFSSAALAVNVFGPFRHQPKRFAIAGVDGFEQARFEYLCPDGLQGMRPRFDFWALSPGIVVAVESKFLGTLSPREAEFSEEYIPPFVGTATASAIAEKRWMAVFRALRDDPKTYRYLDAAQLMKHYLGLKHSYPDRRRVLLYVFWEPTNAAEITEFRDHRREVVDFNQRVSGLESSFIALSYPDLWSEWESHSTWSGMAEHISRLRARYSFAI
jgi:hypothetical protein